MPMALPARRADLKRFSRAMRSRSPRVVAIGAYYLHDNYSWWLTSDTNCSYIPPRNDPGGAMLPLSRGALPTPQRRASPWTTERIRLLRRRWRRGARVREIAAELGHGITCNAVISKIHRLGISRLSPYGGAPGRRYTANTRPADRPVHAQRAAWWFRKGPLPAWVVDAKPYVETVGADARIPRRQRRSLLELNDETCSWPVGDPRSSRFFFCGARPVPNKSYCAAHCARAYRRRGESTRRVSTSRPRHATRDADRSLMPSSETATLRGSTGERK